MLVLKPWVQEDPWANGYVLIEGSYAILIDAVNFNQSLPVELQQQNIQLECVLLTHGHYDHIVGLPTWMNPSCAVYLHDLDAVFLQDPHLNGSKYQGHPFSVQHSTRSVKQDQTLTWRGHRIQVMHTPFHTPGSVCYYLPDHQMLFSGDTLFKQGIGRTDLPLSNPQQVEKSLKRLMSLPPQTDVYPGHGDPTTIQKEWLNMQSMMK